jgi:hypothetical protein
MMEYVLLVMIIAFLIYGLYTTVNVGGFFLESIRNIINNK